ncbi:MAG TPA: amino acid ABC transporter substrate-binding protein [Acidimicrobiia bacterium]|jgi:general L-amino acid transport system substrate-binding protein
MVKRLLALVAVLTLVVAACGGSAEDEETTTTVADGETTTTVADGDAGQTGEGTLAAVIARGELNCGVSGAAVAFSETQPDGSATGFDADYCRAVAAAVLGDPEAVQFRALTAAERFDVLKSGDIDVLIRNTTFTQDRDAGTVSIDFGPTTYYDGQQVMGPSDTFSEASTAPDLDGATVCTNAGTTTEKNISEWAQLGGASITVTTFEDFPAVMEAFKSGSCDAVTTDGSGLAGNKAAEVAAGTAGADTWVIFPPAPLSKEPLGPAYREGDSEWADVINWVVYATIIADEKGITSANVGDNAWEADPEAVRLFGGEGEFQTAMGLPADAFLQVISQVGNYDEIFTRNLNPVGLFRDGSPNASYLNGGLIYSPPAR